MSFFIVNAWDWERIHTIKHADGKRGQATARNRALRLRRLREGRRWENREMANLVMVYGMRLLPADEVAKIDDAPVELKNGNHASVTMHVLEGSREQIEAQLRLSIDAFFDFYPER